MKVLNNAAMTYACIHPHLGNRMSNDCVIRIGTKTKAAWLM